MSAVSWGLQIAACCALVAVGFSIGWRSHRIYSVSLLRRFGEKRTRAARHTLLAAANAIELRTMLSILLRARK